MPENRNINPGQLRYNVRKHFHLSPWVSSQLRTLRYAPLWGPEHTLGHSLTSTFLPSHTLPHILSQRCRRPGTIKKMFTHLLPVMPNVWTLITHLNSKKINRSHLSQPEKSSDSFTAFSQGFCWATLVLLCQPPGLLQCSPGAARCLITLCSGDQMSVDLLLHRHWSC